jgi:hypothetical protein
MLKERPKYGLIILAQGDKRVGALYSVEMSVVWLFEFVKNHQFLVFNDSKFKKSLILVLLKKKIRLFQKP